MTTTWWFPDNTVLCNFGVVGRLDLLRNVVRGRGRWVEAIASEVDASVKYIPVLETIRTEGWLGEPIEIVDRKLKEAVARTRRVVFSGSDQQPLKHLGEAQTCELIRNTPEFSGSWWITDDQEALRYAQHQGITTRETITIVSTAVIEGEITAEAGYELMQQMVDNGRALRMPNSAKALLE